MFTQPDASYHGLVYTEHYGNGGLHRPLPQRLPAHDGRRAVAAERVPAAAGHRDGGAAHRPARRERAHAWPSSCATIRASTSVNYAGFPDNPYYPLVQKYLGGRACSLMTFEIRGGFEAGMRFYNALKLFKRLVNLGDAKSLACHPASTTHRQMSPEEQRHGGRRAGHASASASASSTSTTSSPISIRHWRSPRWHEARRPPPPVGAPTAGGRRTDRARSFSRTSAITAPVSRPRSRALSRERGGQLPLRKSSQRPPMARFRAPSPGVLASGGRCRRGEPQDQRFDRHDRVEVIGRDVGLRNRDVEFRPRPQASG